MKISLTLFKNTFDNKTHRQMNFDGWSKFEKLLYDLSNRPGSKGGRDSSPLISPASYVENTTRSNKNVEKWCGWCAVDIDSYKFDGDLKEALNKQIGDWHYVCYSTASSREDFPKFRLVFPLTRDVEADEIRHFWYAINKELDGMADEQTKDSSRMYYVPAIYPNAYNFIFTNVGEKVNPDEVMGKYEYKKQSGNSFLDRLPPEMQKAVIEHRKNSMTTTNVVWSGYRDCPFFPKYLAIEYGSISEGGWYHKMYQIMVAIAGTAIKRGYPITAKQVAELCRQLDNDNGKWYTNRPLEVEADRAVEYAYRNN